MSTKFPCEKRLRLKLRKGDGTKPTTYGNETNIMIVNF